MHLRTALARTRGGGLYFVRSECVSGIDSSAARTRAAAASLSSLTSASIELAESCVRVATSDGTWAKFHDVWLRDHCVCTQCRDPRTLQRTFDTAKLLAQPVPAPLSVTAVSSSSGGDLVTEWPDGHVSRFPWSWLAPRAYWGTAAPPVSSTRDVTGDAAARRLWTAADFGERGASGALATRGFPCVPHEPYMTNDRVLLRALTLLRDWGFFVVEGVPLPPDVPSAAPAVRLQSTGAALRRIGHLRSTLYSADTWEVVVKPTTACDNNDTAFSTLALPAHTDGNYWRDPPGIQAFHCTAADSGGGGDTLLVDGFAVADQLRRLHPRSFQYLSASELPYHHSEAGDVLTHWHPVIGLDDGGGVASFHFNNDDRAPFAPRERAYRGVSDRAAFLRQVQGGSPAAPTAPSQLEGARSEEDAVPAFYAHLRVLLGVIRDPANEVWLGLRPGSLLVFDNTRCMHGRSALSGPSCGRILAGAYLDADTWRGRMRALHARLPVGAAETD